ncbi:hypothetical protein [Colwellia sp. UCD-KL20]|nr:hypothetical protein [Colwellia sp. UCD-KL20]
MTNIATSSPNIGACMDEDTGFLSGIKKRIFTVNSQLLVNKSAGTIPTL